jgi:hypothetical protein
MEDDMMGRYGCGEVGKEEDEHMMDRRRGGIELGRCWRRDGWESSAWANTMLNQESLCGGERYSRGNVIVGERDDT